MYKLLVITGKWGLNPFPNKPWFLYVYSIGLLKTLWEKEKLLIFSPFPSVFTFYPFGELCHFHPIQNCHVQSLSGCESPNVVVWERVTVSL